MLNLLFSLSIVYLLLCLSLFIFQRDLIYFPAKKYPHNYDSQLFYIDGENIEVIILNKGKKKGVLYFGGNAESVLHSADYYIKDLPDATVYLVNYRGYGGSSGVPKESILYSDALHIYDHIKEKHRNISVIGRSLGSGVATYLSANRDIDKMLLITPFDSIENVAKSLYPIFPISLLLRDKFDSIGRVKSITATTLILLAQYDKVIPFKNSKQLINAFPKSQIKVNIIKDSGHNNLSMNSDYHILLSEFMR